MSILEVSLERLGLLSYLSTLAENGFHNWETVLDITEDDLIVMNFKLGHRRALQREIATFRGVPLSESLDLDAVTSETSTLSNSNPEQNSGSLSPPLPREKRRYRRHPRPDINAPKKPKTAYVNFADQLRAMPEINALSFVDIAKEVGRRWQVLPIEQKRIWESHAARDMQDYELQIDEYKKTDAWRRYQSYLAEFKSRQLTAKPKRPSAAPRIDSFMRGESSRGSPASSDSPASSLPAGSAGIDSELPHDALAKAFGEIVSLRDETFRQGYSCYNAHDLPPEASVRRAAHAFMDQTGPLFYVWDHSQIDDLLERIYRPRALVDVMSLAECFSIAALGSRYDEGCFTHDVRTLLYASATLHFNEHTARVDYLRSMRLLLTLSLHAHLEKHPGAKYLVAAGLQLARWKCPTLPDHGTANSWKRISRSLVFMECCLSRSLDYRCEATAEDIKVFCIHYEHVGTDEEDVMHTQFCKLGALLAEAVTTKFPQDGRGDRQTDLLLQRLEALRVGTPFGLSLESFYAPASTHLNLSRRKALVVMHIMYEGAVLSLYRRKLAILAESQMYPGDTEACRLRTENAQRCHEECLKAAQNTACLLGTIPEHASLSIWNWLISDIIAISTTYLLLETATKLLQGDYNAECHIKDLEQAKTCTEFLQYCCGSGHLLPQHIQDFVSLRQLEQALRDLNQRGIARARTSIGMLLRTDESQHPKSLGPAFTKAELSSLMEELERLLRLA